MQRNWDVLRKIMILVEALPTRDSEVDSTNIPGIAPEVAAYHMRLLMDAGLADGDSTDSMPGKPEWAAVNTLTWDGHELLDKIRRDNVWHRIRAVARDKGIELSLEVIKAVGKSVIEGLLR